MFSFCSIIVPTYNRPAQLAACLQALACQEYPRDRFEVIVVDDGSPTSQESVVAAVQNAVDITLLRQTNAGPAAARNTGATKARGDILVFTDDDCSPAPDWLSRIAAHAARVPGCALGGRTENRLVTNIWAVASQYLITFLYSYFNNDPAHARFLTSNNLAFPADRFREIGGFDTSYSFAGGEDRDLCDRWLHRGYRIIYIADAVVYHMHDLTWRTFWRQHFNYGRAALHFHEGRTHRNQGRIELEPVRFYIKLLLSPYLQKGFSMVEQRRVALSALLLVSQVANAYGYFTERMTQLRHRKQDVRSRV